jgi:hypothetical protein
MDESALGLRLPTTFADLPHFLPNATQLIRGNHAESAYTRTSRLPRYSEHHQLPAHVVIAGNSPLCELLRWVQCFVPGLGLRVPVIPVPGDIRLDVGFQGERPLESSGQYMYPEAKWLLDKEDVLREVFGCIYFRHLLAASQRGE